MAKLTLLEIVQDILSDMDSDEVDSISDTTESRQVAQIVKTTYFNILTRADLPELKTVFSLTASGDASLPVLMYRPDNVSRIEWIKYNRSTADQPQDTFAYITILPIQQYMEMNHALNTLETNVDTFTLDGHTFYYKNDLAPCYCTIVDDINIVFDSINLSLDSTLQSSKTFCYGQTIPAFLLSDTFIPDLDDQQFPLLLNEAKSVAFFRLKQMPDAKAEKESKRQWSTLQRTKSLNKVPTPFDQLAYYGRK